MSDLPPERHEAKYPIPEAHAQALSRALPTWCDPDRTGGGIGYVIISLYLDSPEYALYHATRDRAPRRFKLRVRRYAEDKVFLEIKRRIKDRVAKRRAALPARVWPHIMHDPRIIDTVELKPKAREVVERFISLTLMLNAQPAALVRYTREAWSSRIDDYARVTFDRRILGRAPEGWSVPLDDLHWWPVDPAGRFELMGSGVVLELKSLPAVPHWMLGLADRFGLRRTGFSKYGSVIENLAHRDVRPSRVAAPGISEGWRR